jgi:hypothetical protein
MGVEAGASADSKNLVWWGSAAPLDRLGASDGAAEPHVCDMSLSTGHAFHTVLVGYAGAGGRLVWERQMRPRTRKVRNTARPIRREW